MIFDPMAYGLLKIVKKWNVGFFFPTTVSVDSKNWSHLKQSSHNTLFQFLRSQKLKIN